MTRSAKSILKRSAADDPRMGRVVNDNNPVLIPGHALSDLDDLLRQPVTETVAHYGDFSQIASFPIRDDTTTAAASAPAMDAVASRHAHHVLPAKKRVASACVGSFLFHAVLFAALTTTMIAMPEDPVEEAGNTVSVVMLGDSDADQMAAGDKNKEPDPETVVADAVQPDIVQPTEVKAVEAQPAEPQPTETPAVEAAQPLQQVSTETVVSAEPEVLTSEIPADTSVVQPMATEVQPVETQPSEAVPVQQSVETAEVSPTPVPPDEPVTPTEKPLAAKPVEKPKPVAKKQPPKPAKIKAGSEGSSEVDSKKGSSEGTENARSDQNSESASSRSGSGSAAVANYPGKVGSRIRRSVRVPAEYKRTTASMNVVVHLTIGAGGDLTSLSVVRSSGVPELDSAVIEGVRRAAPFPPLPPEWGKASWSFNQPVQVTGG